MSTEAVISAVLHDVVEDTEVTLQEIKERFGSVVESNVCALTKPERGTPNRSDIYQRQLLNGSHDARRIKLLDIQDNLSDVEEFMGEEQAMNYRKDREALADILKASLR
jgi:GTP pyrophosphokinase